MNALLAFAWPISVTVVERLGWVLVHSLWQFALVALLAAVTVRAMRRCSAVMRYVVLVLAMAVSVVVPVAMWMMQPGNEPDDLASRAALAPGLESTDAWTNRRADATPLAGGSIPASDQEVESLTPDLPASSVASTLSPTAPPAPSWSERATTALRPWLAWIVAAWSLGVVLCSARPLLGWCTLWRLQRVGVSPAPDEVRSAMRRVSARLGLRRAARVLQSTLARVPVVVGYVRPLILLPVSLMTTIPAAQLEAILAHELAHVQRHDFVVNLLQTLVETLFFYHPAVWWLSHQIRVEREHCCDDLVVALLGNRVEYGRALVAIEQMRGQSNLLALGATDGSLLSRVRRIVGGGADRAGSQSVAARQSNRWPALCLGATCALLALMALRIGMEAAADQSKKMAGVKVELETVARSHREYGILSRLKSVMSHVTTDADREFMSQQYRTEGEIGWTRVHDPIRPFAERRLTQAIRDATLFMVHESAWPLIGELQSLERLFFSASDLRGHMHEISRLDRLREFSTVNCKFGIDDLAMLKQHSRLEKIYVMLSVFDATDEAIAEQLGELSVDEQQWLDGRLASRPATWHDYRAEHAALLTDRALQQLSGLKHLKVLKLINTDVSGRDLAALAEMRQLEELDVNFLTFDVNAARVLTRLPSLKSFQSASVTDDVLAELAKLPNLEQLTVWGEGVTDSGARSLSQCKKLHNLTLRGSQITDAGLEALSELPDLRFLELIYGASDVSDAGIKRFRERHPNCKMELRDRQQKDEPDKSKVNLLEAMIKQPTLTILQQLLSAAGTTQPEPIELLDEGRPGPEKKGSQVKVIGADANQFAIVSARVRPVIGDVGGIVEDDPRNLPECAFVFDRQGRLIATLGGQIRRTNQYHSHDYVDVLSLGPEEDWFVRVTRGEKNEPFELQSDYYRIVNPVVNSLRYFNYMNSNAWSHGPEKIPRHGTLYFDFPRMSDKLVSGATGMTPDGVAVNPIITWDGDRNRFVGVAAQRAKGKPLYQVDAEWSRDFEPLAPKPDQLVVSGGARREEHWHSWQTVVPDKFEAAVTLTIPQHDGPPQVIRKNRGPGAMFLTLHDKPNDDAPRDDAPSASLDLYIGEEKETFELPHPLGDRPATHLPIVQVLNPGESARLLNRPLKSSSDALIFEIKLQPLGSKSANATDD